MTHKKQLVEYWHDTLLSRGFHLDFKLQGGTQKMVSYSNGDIKILYSKRDLEDGISPYFYLFLKDSIEATVTLKDKRVSGSFASSSQSWMDETSIFSVTLLEFLFVLDNITKTEKLPLLLGLKWASKLVASLLKDQV